MRNRQQPLTWAQHHARRMAAIERSEVPSIPHVLLFTGALLSVVFLR